MNVSLRICALALTGVALSGCGGGSSTPSGDTTPATTGTAPTINTAPDPSSGGQPPKVALTDGVYTAPGTTFTFRPDPSWDSADAGGELYFATNAARTDTITVVGEGLEGAPSNLDDYVTVSLESAPDEITNFKLRSRRTITLPSGDRAQRIEFTGSVDGSPPLRFLTLVTISKTYSVQATFAAPQSHFAKVVGDVEPVLRTVDVN